MLKKKAATQPLPRTTICPICCRSRKRDKLYRAVSSFLTYRTRHGAPGPDQLRPIDLALSSQTGSPRLRAAARAYLKDYRYWGNSDVDLLKKMEAALDG